MSNIRHWLQLSLTSMLGPVSIPRVIEYAGSAEKACGLSAAQLAKVEGIGPVRSEQIARGLAKSAGLVEEELSKAADAGVDLVCLEDPDYPAPLKEIHDPPVVLYVRGNFEPRDLNSVAIVGSRNCTHYGREQAERFGASLAGAGFTVISGGARGIDSSAHRGAIRHPQGRTIAVLGSGIDVPYPAENEPLFNQIALRGAVVSEYPMGTPPTAENFPRRNRIVSGMSRGVLVIEASIKSGALITARLAGDEQGRALFALPGKVDNPQSQGPHQLIRDGATLVTSLEDILEGLGPLGVNLLLDSETEQSKQEPHSATQSPATTAAAPPISSQQSLILKHLQEDHRSADQLIESTGLDASIIMRELTFLTLKGWIRRVDGQMYARVNR